MSTTQQQLRETLNAFFDGGYDAVTVDSNGTLAAYRFHDERMPSAEEIILGYASAWMKLSAAHAEFQLMGRMMELLEEPDVDEDETIASEDKHAMVAELLRSEFLEITGYDISKDAIANKRLNDEVARVIKSFDGKLASGLGDVAKEMVCLPYLATFEGRVLNMTRIITRGDISDIMNGFSLENTMDPVFRGLPEDYNERARQRAVERSRYANRKSKGQDQ